MAQGRRAGSAARRYSGSGHGFGAAPPITSGLVFFGDLSSPATSIVSGAVATLGDASGNGRNFTQGTAANRPAYTASDANFGGRPSMTFDGNDWLSGPSFAAMGNTTIYVTGSITSYLMTFDHIFCIGNPGSGDAVGVYLGGAATLASGRYDHPGGSASIRDITIGSSPVRLAYSGAISAGGALWTTYLDGSASGADVSTGATAGGTTDAAALSAIGSNLSGTQTMLGKIVSILVYNAAHSAAQVAQVDAWLKWRNGL